MKSSVAFLTALSVLMFVAHCKVVAQTPCWVPPASLVSWWTGDHNERDLYGVNNPTAVHAVTLVPAKVAHGLTFGSGGYIDIPPSPTLANQTFTWDAWVKPEGPGPNNDSFGSIVLQQGIDNNHVSVSLDWRDNPDDRFAFFFGNVVSEAIYSKDTFPPGTFYFVAATYDGTIFRLYVNGVLEGMFKETKTVPYSSETWEIGSAGPISRSEGLPRTFNGIIDEVEAFKGALSQSAIQAIYQKGSVGKCKAPVVLTPTSLKFATQIVGTTSSAQSITVLNNRNNTISMNGFPFTGADPTDFAEASTTCGSSLGGRKKCRVSIAFTPQAIGTRTAVLNVNDSVSGSPQTVQLSGTGVTGETLTGYCVHEGVTPFLCGLTFDSTQCPPGQPAINPATIGCGVGGSFTVDQSRGCSVVISGGLRRSGSCQSK